MTEQDPLDQLRKQERQMQDNPIAAQEAAQKRGGKLYQRAIGLLFMLAAVAALFVVIELIPDY